MAPSPEQTLEDFIWDKRPIVVFADSELDPNFIEQMAILRDAPEELIERDVIVLIDTDPAQKSAIRKKLRPRGFSFVLIGKDGQTKLRKPLPWNIREISRAIDKMPIRQREIKASKTR
ncbi:DUF4174 domain-containing protein [Rhodobacteraceae bacterium]|nr:DUF4174 domain-containing protein [Paracoccaceae bacterium]